ncbi:MAG: hypothetical protein OIF57_02930 [Marinobacterium sp.]|nr:hypothetical protein [Marinobacterium sp.]
MAVEPLWIFLVTGFVAMAGALSASGINKLAEEDKPAFAQTPNGQTAVILAGNLAALTLIGAMAYGFRLLDLWIPATCLFFSFPAVYILLFQNTLGDAKSFVMMMPLVPFSIGALYYYWQ